MAEVEKYLTDRSGDDGMTIAQLAQLWAREKSYEKLWPTAACESERELFSSHLRAILSSSVGDSTFPGKTMVVDGANAKGSPFANKKNKSDKSRRHVLTNQTLDDLRRELRLIDKAIAALINLSRLRQPRRGAKRRSFD